MSRQLFRNVRAQRLLLEYDDERSGSFAPLQDVGDDKFIVLGLITTKRSALESIDSLRRRVTEACRYLPMERLGLSPQCGFASSIIGNKISFDEQKRKLDLVVRAERSLWG